MARQKMPCTDGRLHLEISTAHTHDLTQAFQKLVKAGWLTSSGHGRGTVYYQPGKSLPTPDQVFGLAISSDNSGSEYIGSSSEHLPQSSEHFTADSEHSKREQEGWLRVDGLEKPLIDKLKELSPAIRIRYEQLAQLPREKGKLPRQEMEKIIMDLCRQNYLTLQVLAELLGRTSDALRQQHLKPLVGAGQLRLAFPTTPTHPQQAYITVEDDGDD